MYDLLYHCSAKKDENIINIYDGRGTNEPIHVLKLHTKPVTCIKVFWSLYYHFLFSLVDYQFKIFCFFQTIWMLRPWTLIWYNINIIAYINMYLDVDSYEVFEINSVWNQMKFFWFQKNIC